MRRLLETVFVAVLLSMVAAGPALAQYPPSPAPGPTSQPTPSERPSGRPTPQPTPTQRPGTDPSPEPPAPTPGPAVPTPAPGPTSGGSGSQIIIGGGGSGGGGGGSSSGIVPGQSVTLRGSGYLPNSSVDIVLNSKPRHLGTVMTDGQGSFEITVTIPSDVEVGSHTMTLSGINADGSPRTDSIPVQIAAEEGVIPVKDPAAAPAPGSAGGLANTGLQLTNGVAVIGVLLAGGGGMLLLARRRRRGMSVSEA